MDADVVSLAIDWMYGSLNKPLDLQQAAHMMRAGDRLSILALREASARICCDCLEHMLPVPPVEDSQIGHQVEEILRFAEATGATDVAEVRIVKFLLYHIDQKLKDKSPRLLHWQ